MNEISYRYTNDLSEIPKHEPIKAGEEFRSKGSNVDLPFAYRNN